MDPCWLCQCRGGISFCSKAECAELDCENFYIPEGECCPVCIGTCLTKVYSGKNFEYHKKIVFVVSRYRARLTKTTNQHQVIPAFPFVDILSDRVIYYNRADVRALKTVWDDITKA